MTTPVLIAVDVGTGSARAGVFDAHGTMHAHESHPIEQWQYDQDYFEQSSDDIWRAVCNAVRRAIDASGSGVRPVGIGFTATCSLVAVTRTGEPVTVSRSGNRGRNVMLWMDHRAREETERINAIDSRVLSFVGGRISEEMQLPKLMWLKHHLPDSWRAADYFFDLPDFLTWRASGSATRSVCSVTCKWTYLAHDGGWDRAFLRDAGLDVLLEDDAARIGGRVANLGETVGRLTADAAAELGLPQGLPVAASIIDAHAGGLGILGATAEGGEQAPVDFAKRMALIAGTSNCHMAVSRDPHFVGGVWGPYFSAMVPGYWLNEGGQSAAGALIDHLLDASSVGVNLYREARGCGKSVYELLNEMLFAMAADAGCEIRELTAGLHVCPDFHGNRSPLADPDIRGMISGLPLSNEPRDVALLYLAAIQAIAYGTRHIVDAFNRDGYAIDTLLACGGGTKNPLMLTELADATGLPVMLGDASESVLLGAAMLASVGAGMYADLHAAMSAMSRIRRVVEPAGARAGAYHDRKFCVSERLYDDQRAYRAMMAER